MARFRKKPVVIDAFRLKGNVKIHTLEGIIHGDTGDWLIVGIEGEMYPCKHDIFVQTYEPINEGNSITYWKKEVENE